MTIELEVKELSIKDVHNRDSYKEIGLYLVNDGVVWLLVNVGDTRIQSICLPNKNVIKQYEFNAKSRCMEDIKGTVYGKLDYIIDVLERQDEVPLAVQPINTDLDIDKITKLVQSINAPFMNVINRKR